MASAKRKLIGDPGRNFVNLDIVGRIGSLAILLHGFLHVGHRNIGLLIFRVHRDAFHLVKFRSCPEQCAITAALQERCGLFHAWFYFQIFNFARWIGLNCLKAISRFVGCQENIAEFQSFINIGLHFTICGMSELNPL
ncbi:hypothetical protein D3C85_1280930 [compost metagenome]